MVFPSKQIINANRHLKKKNTRFENNFMSAFHYLITRKINITIGGDKPLIEMEFYCNRDLQLHYCNNVVLHIN